MTKKRPVKLTWKGKSLPDGRPVSHLGDYGIPPETLEGEALDAMSVEQIGIAREHPDLYAVTEAPEPKVKKAPAKSAPKADDPPAPDETPAAPPVDDAPAEPDEKGG